MHVTPQRQFVNGAAFASSVPDQRLPTALSLYRSPISLTSLFSPILPSGGHRALIAASPGSTQHARLDQNTSACYNAPPPGQARRRWRIRGAAQTLRAKCPYTDSFRDHRAMLRAGQRALYALAAPPAQATARRCCLRHRAVHTFKPIHLRAFIQFRALPPRCTGALRAACSVPLSFCLLACAHAYHITTALAAHFRFQRTRFDVKPDITRARVAHALTTHHTPFAALRFTHAVRTRAGDALLQT